MKKINFGSLQLRILCGLLIVTLMILIFNIIDSKFLYLGLVPSDYQLIILSLMIIFALLCLFKYNYIQYNHDTLVIKINRLFSQKISFKFIEDYKIENNKLSIYFRDNTEQQFSLRHIHAKDIERLDYIIDIHVHDFI